MTAQAMRRSGLAALRRLERGARAPLPPCDLRGHGGAAIEVAGRAWTMKAEQEWRSAAVFNSIAAGLLEAGGPLDLLAALAEVVRDEIAHAAICLEMAGRLGAPQPAASAGAVAERGRSAPDRRASALAMLLFEGAVGETISALLFHAGRRAAAEPGTRAALSAILRDEARHARLCWAGLAALWPECNAADREWLQLQLQRSFGPFEQQSVRASLDRLERGERFDPSLAALGVLPPEVRVDTFYRGLERLVLPRLASLGLDARGAWQRRYAPI